MKANKLTKLNVDLKHNMDKINFYQKLIENICNEIEEIHIEIHNFLIESKFYDNVRIPVGECKGIVISEVYEIKPNELTLGLGLHDYTEIQIRYDGYENIRINYYNSLYDDVTHILDIINLSYFENEKSLERLINRFEKHLFVNNKKMFADDAKNQLNSKKQDIIRDINKLQQQLNVLNANV